jgi:hypothetical protein
VRLATFNHHNVDQIVIKEIECWIMAGISEKLFQQWKIQLNISNTEIYSKEEICKELKDRTNFNPSLFLSMIINSYDLHKGRTRNHSFDNFINEIEGI